MVERGHAARPAHGASARWRDIAERVPRRGLRPPAVTRGRARSRRCATSSPGSSSGRCTGAAVAVTRARAQASGLAAPAGARSGAEVVETPAIRIEPRPLDEVAAVDAIRTTRWSASRARTARAAARRPSSAAATRARSPAPPSRRSARAPPPSCARRGIRADVVPERSVAEALVEALADVDGGGPARAGGPRRRGARRAARRAARARRPGRRASRSTTPWPSRSADDQLAALARADYVTFTSSSTVRFFMRGRRRGAPGTARGSSRSARSRARPRASTGSRCTWRPSATTSTAWWRRLLADAAAR